MQCWATLLSTVKITVCLPLLYLSLENGLENLEKVSPLTPPKLTKIVLSTRTGIWAGQASQLSAFRRPKLHKLGASNRLVKSNPFPISWYGTRDLRVDESRRRGHRK